MSHETGNGDYFRLPAAEKFLLERLSGRKFPDHGGWGKRHLDEIRCRYRDIAVVMQEYTVQTCSPLWSAVNRRRGVLVDRKIAGTITPDELEELSQLQALASEYVHRVAPRPEDVLCDLEKIVSAGKS